MKRLFGLLATLLSLAFATVAFAQQPQPRRKARYHQAKHVFRDRKARRRHRRTQTLCLWLPKALAAKS